MAPENLLEGVIVPMLTPFDAEGNVDEEAIESLVIFLREAGIHRLNPCGTTGEGLLLSTLERKRVAERTVLAAGDLPILVQTGAASTNETIELTRHAQRIGAAGATVVAPYYYRYSEDALVHHYVSIAQSVGDFPIVLYNIPQLAGNDLTLEAVARIADRCPNVIGIKDSSGNLLKSVELTGLESRGFRTVIGSDGLILPGMISGARGMISGNANVFPEIFLALYQSFVQGDWQTAAAIQEKVHAVRRILSDGADISLFKVVLKWRGVDVGQVRPPMRSATAQQTAHCIERLSELGLLHATPKALRNGRITANGGE